MENFDALKSIEAKIERDAAYLIASIIIMSIGMVVPVDMTFGKFNASLFLSGFMIMTGIIFGTLLILDIVVSTSHFHDWHKAQISAYRFQQGLPLPKYEKQNIDANKPQVAEPVEPKQPISIVTEQRNNSNSVTWTIENHPDRPSNDFIKHVYTSKDESNLIPTVRELQEDGKANGLWNTAQVVRWLNVFDQLEITAKIYDLDRGNSRRCLKQGLTLNEIREKFGYEVNN